MTGWILGRIYGLGTLLVLTLVCLVRELRHCRRCGNYSVGTSLSARNFQNAIMFWIAARIDTTKMTREVYAPSLFE
jgi:hypothetical protein